MLPHARYPYSEKIILGCISVVIFGIIIWASFTVPQGKQVFIQDNPAKFAFLPQHVMSEGKVVVCAKRKNKKNALSWTEVSVGKLFSISRYKTTNMGKIEDKRYMCSSYEAPRVTQKLRIYIYAREDGKLVARDSFIVFPADS